MSRTDRQSVATSRRFLVNSLLVLSLLFSQWWLLHHESDFAAHPEDTPCEFCVALNALDQGDNVKIPGIHVGDTAIHTVSTPAVPPLSRHTGMVRSRGPPAALS